MTHLTEIQPRFADFDMFGHVNNIAYMQYLDLAKAMFFNDITGQPFDPEAVSSVIVNINVDYMAPTLPGEPLAVSTCCSHVGHRSYALRQQVLNTATGAVKCAATTTLAGFDVHTQQGADLPANLHAALTKNFEENAN